MWSLVRHTLMTDAKDGTAASLFGSLPSDISQRIVLSKGSYVFAADDPTHGLFLVESGRVRLIRHAIDGSEFTLHIAQAGETFAEASLFADHYHCDAVADLPTTVLAFDKEHILAYLASDPIKARQWINHLSKQIQNLRAQAMRLSLNSADDRLLSFLRMHCTDGPVMSIDRPWKTIASELGMAHETLYRTLARLERKGLIVRNHNSSTVELTRDRSRQSS